MRADTLDEGRNVVHISVCWSDAAIRFTAIAEQAARRPPNRAIRLICRTLRLRQSAFGRTNATARRRPATANHDSAAVVSQPDGRSPLGYASCQPHQGDCFIGRVRSATGDPGVAGGWLRRAHHVNARSCSCQQTDGYSPDRRATRRRGGRRLWQSDCSSALQIVMMGYQTRARGRWPQHADARRSPASTAQLFRLVCRQSESRSISGGRQ